jgi:TolB-like protein
MVTFRMLSLGAIIFAVSLTPLSKSATADNLADGQLNHQGTASTGPTIAVADFSGQDKDLGRFLADTLLTDLAQSDRLHLVERSEIRQALSELKLQSTGLVEPQQVQKIGKMLGADRLIVGSYLVRDNQLILNARLLDVHTGKVAQGDAANVTGRRDSVLPLVHRLAHLFHKRMTGSDFALGNEQGDDTGPANSSDTIVPDNRSDAPLVPVKPAPDKSETDRSVSTEMAAEPPAFAVNLAGVSYGAPNAVVTEQDLASLVRQIAGPVAVRSLTIEHPSAPVTRLRVLAALVKTLTPTLSLAAYRSVSPSHLTPDAGSLPLWGRPYVASAVERGLWPAQRPLHGGDPATWAFVRAVVTLAAPRPPVTIVVAQARQDVGLRVRTSAVIVAAPLEQEVQGAYTGLVIDAHDLSVQRAMSVRILDEDGRVVYPAHGHIPDIDWLEDNGMVSYHRNGNDLPRAGSKPLYVRALRVSGDDFIVSNETADRILDENSRSKFLWKWSVCVLQDEGL